MSDDDVRARLDELARLRAEGVISEDEYHHARDVALMGAEGAAAMHEAEMHAHPPHGDQPTRVQEPAASPGGGGSGAGGRRPGWLVPVIGGVAILAAVGIGLGLYFGLSGGGDDNAYATAVEAPLADLGNSAGVIASGLAATKAPGDIAPLRTSITQQIAAATAASQAINAAQASAADAAARTALQSGAKNYSLYLQDLLRAAAPNPGDLGASIASARTRVATLKGDFTAARNANAALDVEPILSAGLGSTSGLKAAQDKKAADAAAAAAAAAAANSSSSSGGSAQSSNSFQSPTGNIHCAVSSSTVMTCSTDNDSANVSLPAQGAAYTGSGLVSGGPVLGYGQTWESDSFVCTSSTDGMKCTNITGNGFFINRDSLETF